MRHETNVALAVFAGLGFTDLIAGGPFAGPPALLLAAALAGRSALRKGPRGRTARALLLALALEVGMLASLLCWEVSVCRSKGLRLESALESYRQREGNYPPRLQDLVPRDLDAIPALPRGLWGTREIWYVLKADSYKLWFPVYLWYVSRYTPEERRWSIVSQLR